MTRMRHGGDLPAAERLPHRWVTAKLVDVSTDGRTVCLYPMTRHGAVLWDRSGPVFDDWA
jgi:hypothetical protein